MRATPRGVPTGGLGCHLTVLSRCSWKNTLFLNEHDTPCVLPAASQSVGRCLALAGTRSACVVLATRRLSTRASNRAMQRRHDVGWSLYGPDQVSGCPDVANTPSPTPTKSASGRAPTSTSPRADTRPTRPPTRAHVPDRPRPAHQPP